MSDQPTGESLSSQGDRKRFMEEAQAAADYIATNIKGRMVRATKVGFRVDALPTRGRPPSDEPLQGEPGEPS